MERSRGSEAPSVKGKAMNGRCGLVNEIEMQGVCSITLHYRISIAFRR